MNPLETKFLLTVKICAVVVTVIILIPIISYTLTIAIGPDFIIDSGYFYQSGSNRPDVLDTRIVKPWKRLLHGDLQQSFEDEIVHDQSRLDWFAFMSTMNVMCGNVDIECAYTMYWKSDECHEKCNGQHWYDGYDNYYDACDFIENHWEPPQWEDDDHWDDDHWDDDHWDDDHWDDDHWDDDHREGPLALWNILMETSVDGVSFAFQSRYES